MFDTLKEKLKLETVKDKLMSGVEFSNNLIDETIDRQVGFTTDLLNSSVASSKKLRSCKSVSEFVEVQKEYLKDVQSQVTALNTESTAKLKELRDSATELVTSAIKKEEKKPAAKKKAAAAA